MSEKDPHSALDYEQTISYFHALHDVRFKLLGFLPLLTGAAITFAPDDDPSAQVALACLGFMVTLGLISYDQRNTQIYDRLVCRALYLEKKLGFMPLPTQKFGGPFHCRPPLQKTFGITFVWHIQGLILVYSASLAAWFYLGISGIVCSGGWIAGLTLAAFAVSMISLRFLSNKHHRETKRIKAKIEAIDPNESDSST